MKKLFSILTVLLALGLTSARAELMEWQVGATSTSTAYGNNAPASCYSPNSEAVTIYGSSLINLDAGTMIKQLSIPGYIGTAKTPTYTFTLYLANTSVIDPASFKVSTASSAAIDVSQFTEVATTVITAPQVTGSSTEPVDIITFDFDQAFEYTGQNLAVYIVSNAGGSSSYSGFSMCGVNNANQSNLRAIYRGATWEDGLASSSWSTLQGGGQYSYQMIGMIKLGLQVGGAEEMAYAYVGSTASGQYTSYSPNNSMYAQSEVSNLYTKDLLNLEDNIKIKEIIFNGYSTNDKSPIFTYTLYLANTDSSDPATLLSGGNSSNIDLTKFTQVSTIVKESPKPAYSTAEPGEMLKFEIPEGFVYTGGNLALYVKATSSGSAYYWMYIQKATNATANNAKILMRTGTYESQFEGQSWSSSTSGTNIAAMTVGYAIEGGGVAPTISSTVSGRVVAATSSMTYIEGATVTITETPQEGEAKTYSTTTDSRGNYSITVDPVDTKATYTLKVEKEAYDTYTYPDNLDLKGGNVTMSDIPLVKSPVPATVTGKVLDKVSNVAIAGATVSFNGESVTSGTDGTYSFAIANIDALSQENMTISATAKGYIPYSMGLNNLQGGTNNFNISLSPVPEIPGTGTLIGTWDDINGYSYFAPIYQLSVYTGSQMIYPASLFKGVEVGDRFSSLSFFGYYTMGTGTPDIDDGDDDGYGDYNDPWMAQRRAEEPLKREFDVSVYMVGTAQNTLTADTPIDFENLTPVYEGMIEMPMLGAKNEPAQLITIDLDTPFVFEGKNVAIIIMANRTAKPDDQGTIPYFCIDTSFENNVIYKEAGQPANFAIAEWRVPSSVGNPVGLPIMRLGGFVPTATVSGIVSDKSTNVALEGVEVTLSAEGIASINTLTDARGAYSLSLRDVDYDATYTLSFSYGDYYDESVDVTFTNETLEQTINMQMEKPAEAVNGTITGTVMKAHKDEPLSDVTVTLSMTPAQGATVGNIAMATTDINGNYTINVVDIDLTATYSLAFTREGYNETSATVPFTADNLDVTVNVELVKDPESGIAGISTDFNGDIFTVMGICVKRNANINDVYALPKSIYIIDGKKVIIR